MNYESVSDQRKEWLEQRKAGIGGTDVSALLGLNPWKSPIDVYLGKLGMSERKEPTEAMFWGNQLEQVISNVYAERCKVKVVRGESIAALFPNLKAHSFNEQSLLEHPQADYVLGTPDGIVPELQRGLEIKNVGYKSQEWGTEGTDEIPHHYRLQVAQYMAITDMDAWDVAALFSGNRLQVFTVYRDPELERIIMETACEFWTQHVACKVPPAIDGSETWKYHLAQKFAIGNLTILNPLPEADALGAVIVDARSRQEAAAYEVDVAKNQLAALIGENRGIKLSQGGKVQWVRSKPGRSTDYKSAFQSLSDLFLKLHLDGKRDLDEIIAANTTEQQRAAYVQLYAGKEK